jgi:hypothetical protein
MRGKDRTRSVGSYSNEILGFVESSLLEDSRRSAMTTKIEAGKNLWRLTNTVAAATVECSKVLGQRLEATAKVEGKQKKSDEFLLPIHRLHEEIGA